MTRDLKAIDLAKWLVNHADREAGEAMTHLKVQKLLYFAEAYYLANFNKSLFQEEFQAWAHGPVVIEVWRRFKQYNWDSIPQQDLMSLKFSGPMLDYMCAVYDKFGKLGAKKLEEITHQHAPWKNARGDLPLEAACSNIIEKEVIRDFYAERIGKKWRTRIA
jgi:uncharacterized phage-associated protein